MARRGRAIALLLALAGCGSGGGGGAGGGAALPLRPRPAGAPDVVLLTVSGHTDIASLLLCAEGDNTAYLGDPGDAADVVAEAFESLGLTVQSAHFADRYRGVPGDPLRAGFVDLLATMQAVFDDWIDGVGDPTRLVLLCHSHGSNWAHIATSLFPEIPVAFLITLDGICTAWECEHDSALPGSFPWDIADACARWQVPGQPGLLDTKDVVFPAVRLHIEVRSDDLFISDGRANVRLDGTERDIVTLFSAGETHARVHERGSAALRFVTDAILAVLAVG